MDHVHTLLMLIVPCAVLCGHVPAPDNLTIDSYHFVHLLRWQEGPGSPSGLLYRVIVRSLNEGWKVVAGCDPVLSPLLCNLTDVFSKLDETYYINVTAFLGYETSTPRSLNPFIPASDTVLELPSLRVSPCNDSLCVYLQSPFQRLHTVYDKLCYTLNVTNERGDQFLMTSTGLNTVYVKVVPELQYCVSVNITTRRVTPKAPVCASKPSAVNNADAVISVVLCLVGLMFVVIAGLLLLKAYIHFIALRTRYPLVLRSFKAPYKVQLLSWPAVESLKCARKRVEPSTNGDIQVSEDLDPEKEDEDVGYERREGCEEASEEHTHNPVTETYERVRGNVLQEPTAATPRNTSLIHTTRLLKTSIQELRKNNLSSLMPKRREELEQEEKEDDQQEDSDVNFFSLTLRGRNSEQQEETEEEESKENRDKMSALFVLGPPELAMDIQPVYSEETDKLISYSEEDTEEEDAFSGYMMHR